MFIDKLLVCSCSTIFGGQYFSKLNISRPIRHYKCTPVAVFETIDDLIAHLKPSIAALTFDQKRINLFHHIFCCWLTTYNKIKINIENETSSVGIVKKVELNNFQNNGSKNNNIENVTPSVDGSKKINIENETPSVEIEGLNEVNGTNCCYGHLCLLQDKKEVDDEKKS